MNELSFSPHQATAPPTALTRLGVLLVLTAALLLGSQPVRAGSTDPVLALGSATMEAEAGAGALLGLTGIWHFDDILQVQFPLTVVVHQGSQFVAIPVNGAASAGTFPGLSDGLAASEIPALESAGTPVTASVLRIDTSSMAVAVPDTFSAGLVDVVVYVELPDEGGFVSNRASAAFAGAGS